MSLPVQPPSLEQYLAQLQSFAVAFRGTLKVRMMAQVRRDVVMWHATFDPGPRRRKVDAFGDTPLEAARELSEKLVGWCQSAPRGWDGLDPGDGGRR